MIDRLLRVTCVSGDDWQVVRVTCVSLLMIDWLLESRVSCDDWQVVKSCVSLVMIDRLLESRVCLVMIDRLLEAIDDMKRVIMDSAQFLLTPDKAHYSYSDAALIFDVVCVCTWSLMLWYLIDCHTQHVMNWQFSAGQLSVRYVQWLSTSVHSCPTCAHISKTKQERSIVTVTIVLWPSICSAIEKRFTYLLTYLLTSLILLLYWDPSLHTLPWGDILVWKTKYACILIWPPGVGPRLLSTYQTDVVSCCKQNVTVWTCCSQASSCCVDDVIVKHEVEDQLVVAVHSC